MEPYYFVEKLENGQLMICTKGDVICISDPNHKPGDVEDLRCFRIMCNALNMAHDFR